MRVASFPTQDFGHTSPGESLVARGVGGCEQDLEALVEFAVWWRLVIDHVARNRPHMDLVAEPDQEAVPSTMR